MRHRRRRNYAGAGAGAVLGNDYKSAGVDVKLGNDASKVLFEAARLTWENRKGKLGEVVEVFKDFSGLRAINIGGLPQGTLMNISFDGVGTKMELGERIGKHDTVAFDLFAMVCDDAVRYGAEPVIVGSVLDVKSLSTDGRSHIDMVKQLASGYIAAAKRANVAIVNGEVAELGARVSGYGEFNYNWSAGVVWFARRDRMLTGYDIKEGDALVGLEENGFRSNGLSLVRKVFSKALWPIWGQDWHKAQYNGVSVAQLALNPSTIYSGSVVDMFGGFNREPKAKIHGIAHITGGGLPEKLGRMLKPSGLGANISDPFTPFPLMFHCQEIGGVTDREAYSTWNMGQGMVIATPEPSKVIGIADDWNINAKVIGEVVRDHSITIKDRGMHHKPNEELKFELR